jgi:DNA invertase Pin-like site-specific DNA recombinase
MSSEKASDHSLLGYARVSTLEQREALQVDALGSTGCARVFVDKASGKVERRPALDALLEQLRPGDTRVVWRLDRLGRNLRHLIDTVQTLEVQGVAFHSLTEQIDTSTPGGKLVFHVFGALAELERDLFRERTMAGLAAARACGRTAGRPTVWTADKIRQADAMYRSGEYSVAAPRCSGSPAPPCTEHSTDSSPQPGARHPGAPCFKQTTAYRSGGHRRLLPIGRGLAPPAVAGSACLLRRVTARLLARGVAQDGKAASSSWFGL